MEKRKRRYANIEKYVIVNREKKEGTYSKRSKLTLTAALNW